MVRAGFQLSQRAIAGRLARHTLPLLLFGAFLAWGWRTTDLLHTLPGYGDVLEGVWAVSWYDKALRLGVDPGLYELAFHPAGYRAITYAWGPLNFILLLPLYWLGGASLAMNVATLLSFLIAFAGMYVLSLRFTPRLGATVAALLYTFWGFRWYSITGQLNVSLGSALLPWLIWSLEVAYASPRRAKAWYLLAGAIWAAAVNSSLYFIWIGAVAFAGWLLGHSLMHSANRRALLAGLWVVPLVAALLSTPFVVVFWRASSQAGAAFFSVYGVNDLGASANSLAVPNLLHPWLGPWARQLYRGPLDSEAGRANLGVVACLAALIGLAGAWRSKAWRPIFAIACLGLVLALGLTLRWDGRSVQTGLFVLINRLFWGAAHALKPALFVGASPPAPFTDAIPLPDMLLALLPTFERARVVARYAFLAGMAVFLLAGFGLTRLRRTWLRWPLAALLLFEALPPPTQSWPFPLQPHPAFAWLRQQSIAPEGIAELATTSGSRLELPIGGPTIYATLLHDQATISGPNGVWPAHMEYLNTWLVSHGEPFRNEEFQTLLSYYHVRYVTLQLRGHDDDLTLAEARQSPGLRDMGCFPGSGAPPWDFDICIFEVRPGSAPAMNLLFREGWSGAEDWGRWIDGTNARAIWISAAQGEQRVHIQAFPLCVEGKNQEIIVEANGAPIGRYQWPDCQPWSADLSVPAQALRMGPNELVIRASYAASPIETTHGANPDPRQLSIGVTALRVYSAHQGR